MLLCNIFANFWVVSKSYSNNAPWSSGITVATDGYRLRIPREGIGFESQLAHQILNLEAEKGKTYFNLFALASKCSKCDVLYTPYYFRTVQAMVILSAAISPATIFWYRRCKCKLWRFVRFNASPYIAWNKSPCYTQDNGISLEKLGRNME